MHQLTRMHSSRMLTAHSSSRHGGLHTPPGQIPLNFPLACAPGPDPPQLPPWLWAWTRSPSTSPLAVGLDQIPINFPLGCGSGPYPLPPWVWAWKPTRHVGIPPPGRPAARHAGIPPAMHAGIAHPPPVNRITDACENITSLRAVIISTSFNSADYLL